LDGETWRPVVVGEQGFGTLRPEARHPAVHEPCRVRIALRQGRLLRVRVQLVAVGGETP
jgi:hypothetical protein